MENSRRFELDAFAVQAWRDRILNYSGDLERFPHDQKLRAAVGYSSCQLARVCTAKQFHRVTNVRDVAPRLEEYRVHDPDPKSVNRLVAATRERVKSLLQQVIHDDMARDASDPLRNLVLALWKKWRENEPDAIDYFEIGVDAIEAAVALLGMREYGGVLAAWQLSTLAFPLLGWRDQKEFNYALLNDAEQLYPPSCDEVAAEFGLPDLDYLKAGCIGNVVKAGYRAFCEGGADGHEALRVANQAMDRLHLLPGEVTDQLLFPTMRAMESACREGLSNPVWTDLNRGEAEELLAKLRQIEPSGELLTCVESNMLNYYRESSCETVW